MEKLDSTTKGLMDLMMEVYKIRPRPVDDEWHRKCLTVCEELLRQNPLVADVKVITWDDVHKMGQE